MRISEQEFSELIEIEQKHSASGVVRKNADSLTEFYDRLICAGDAKRAEALVLQQALSPLLGFRALLARGKLDAAHEALTNLGPPTPGNAGHEAELIMEKARLACYEGDWPGALDLCTQALAAGPVPISTLSLYQIRALCRFELGDFRGALSDASCVESLETVFPFSPPVTYAKILRARALARTSNIERGHSELVRIWSRLAETTPSSVEFPVAMLLAESDLRRLSGKSPLPSALAMHRLATISGDELYAALALVDATYGGNAAFRERMLVASREFKRVALLVRQIESRDGGTNAQSIWNYTGASSPVDLELPIDAEHIWIESAHLLIRVSPFGLQPVKSDSQFTRAIAVLARGPQAKEDFFKSVWGRKIYREEAHEEVIKALLKRVRRELGLQVAVVGGQIRLKQLIFIGRPSAM